MIQITADILKKIAPNSNGHLLGELAQEMTTQFPAFKIDTVREYCHFLAQAAHETDSFNALTEYASGRAYEGRKDLGNLVKGWGVKYKGRGIFQVTGRNNYARLNGIFPGAKGANTLLAQPELLAQPKWAVWSACIFWNDRHLSDIANMPDTQLIYAKSLEGTTHNPRLFPVEYITYRINGGFNGMPERAAFFLRAQKIFE